MIKIYSHFDSIEKYRRDWNALAELHKNALLSYDWFNCCAKSFHSRDTLYLVCVIENDTLIAVAPLYRSSHSDQKHLLQIIGNRRLYEPTSLLFRDKAALKLLLKACSDIGHPLLLGRCYQQTDMSTWFPKISLRGFLISMIAASSQYLQIEGDFANYENSLSSKRRYDLRRARKKAGQYGEPDHVIHRVDQANAMDLLNRAYEIENRSWKKQAGSSITLNEDLKSFFSNLFMNISNSDNAVIGFFTIDGKPVASHLAIQQFGVLWILKIGYDQHYASCSPGVLLTHEMIRYAYDNGLDSFEFLGCQEQWIELWKPAIREYHSQLFYPLSYNGIIGLFSDVSTIILSRLRGTRSS